MRAIALVRHDPPDCATAGALVWAGACDGAAGVEVEVVDELCDCVCVTPTCACAATAAKAPTSSTAPAAIQRRRRKRRRSDLSRWVTRLELLGGGDSMHRSLAVSRKAAVTHG